MVLVDSDGVATITTLMGPGAFAEHRCEHPKSSMRSWSLLTRRSASAICVA
jgi:hypothetical protein